MIKHSPFSPITPRERNDPVTLYLSYLKAQHENI